MAKSMLGLSGFAPLSEPLSRGLHLRRVDLGIVDRDLSFTFFEYNCLLAIIIFALLVVSHNFLRECDIEKIFSSLHPLARSLILTFLVLSTILLAAKEHAFIYFQF